MDPNSRKFLQLQEKWYKKLEKSGFSDIEHCDGQLTGGSIHYLNANLERTLSNQLYFNLAGKFLYDYTFETKLDRTIWEYHAEGLSVRDISTKLKKLGIKLSKSPIHQVILRLKKAMLIEYKV